VAKLTLELKVQSGADIWTCAAEATEVAKALNIDVDFVHNDVHCRAMPKKPHTAVVQEWEATREARQNRG
jgi:hypothetical protein